MRWITQHVSGWLTQSGLLLALALAGCADTEAPMVVRHRAMLAELKGDRDTALATRDQFLEEFPNYPFRDEVYREQGETHLALGNLEAAAEYFSKAIEYNDRYLRAYMLRCQVYSLLGRYEDAIADGNRAVELSVSDRELADVLLHQANSEVGLERPERAIVKWRMALVLNPEHLDALGRLFQAHLLRDEIDEALELIENSLDLNDQIAVKHAYYSEVLARLGRLEEAEQALNRAHELNVGDELPLPESIEQFTTVDQAPGGFEEAPVVRVAARPLFPAMEQSAESGVFVELARGYLQEQGIESEAVEGDQSLLRCRGENEEFEILVKTVPGDDPRQFAITQEDLAKIAAQSPPRGLLLVNLPADGNARVAAFTKSWRPDPFRLIPQVYHYQLPSQAE